MVIKSKTKGLDEWLFIEDIPDQYTPDKTMSEKRVEINRNPVRMNNFQLSSSGMFLLYSEMKCEEPAQIRTEVLGETVTSHFIFYKQPSFKS